MLLFAAPGAPVQVRAQSQTNALVYIDPVSTCCMLGRAISIGAVFNVSVRVNLPSGESINGFDVRINYTNPSGTSTPVLQAVSGAVGDSNNIFSGYSKQVVAYCIDDLGQLNGLGCESDDSHAAGQVHFAEAILTSSVPGQVSGGLLFTLQFRVIGNGISQFIVDRANLSSLNPNPSNPQQFNPGYLPVVNGSGIFANSGLVAFFNYRPPEGSQTPAILPTIFATFDAGGSMNADNGSMVGRFIWNFGDGKTENDTMPVTTHAFQRPGTYWVQLQFGNVTKLSSPFLLPVHVLPALGGLSFTIKDYLGTIISVPVTIKIYNQTLSTASPITGASNAAGRALFTSLKPGTYNVTFSAQGYVAGSKLESIVPGWTRPDTVYLQTLVPPPPPPDYSWIFIVPVLAGLVIAATAYVLKSRRSKKGRQSRKR